jgi:hypothetical protein
VDAAEIFLCLSHLKTASQSEPLVSAADKLHNCRALVADLRREDESVWDRFPPREEQLEFYRQFYRTLADIGRNVLFALLPEPVPRRLYTASPSRRGRNGATPHAVRRARVPRATT